jgi:tRNA U34 2-thiouridine synthase MnmA/TrmU
MSKLRAVALISGGLDSALAAKLVSGLGVEVIGAHFLIPFYNYELKDMEQTAAFRSAREIGIELVVRELSEEFIAAVKAPKFGYGKNLNPCVDCKILMVVKAAELMKERDAQFIVTGEVVGQRPMSQRKDIMNVMDKKTGMKGLVLRPLSAKNLAPTVPEEKGWVDREKLLAISGRSRKTQFELADKFGLKEFSAPAGGCLLTMEGFAKKVEDLLERQPDFDANDVRLLKIGRHFRLSPSAKLLVGRNDFDNKKLINVARAGQMLICTDNVPGPAGLLVGKFGEAEIRLAAGIVAYYVHKSPTPEVPLLMERIDAKEKKESVSARPLERRQLEEFRIK